VSEQEHSVGYFQATVIVFRSCAACGFVDMWCQDLQGC